MGLRRTEVYETSFFADWTRENASSPPTTPKPARRAAAPPSDTGRAHRWFSPRARGAVAVVAALTTAGASLLFTSGSASADPSANTWYRLRVCESSNNYSINTGNAHYGAYQFDLATWRSVGGRGYPYLAPKAEQDARALILYRMRGWQPWQCAGILGLREDGDARSGYTGDIHVSSGHNSAGSGSSSSSGIPAFPGGSHQYFYGETSANIRTFQLQLAKRGADLTGTGYYGSKTLTVVKQLQKLNGLAPRGYIGPQTWRLAWTGKYTRSTAAPTSIPAFPGGSHQYFYGETSANIRTFQLQLAKRGADLTGTGYYGSKTLTVVKQLQKLNGLAPRGYIGPQTWRLAWTGKYVTA